MPTKRTPIKRTQKHPITPEAAKYFAIGDWGALHRALGLKPWQTSPLDVLTPEPPDWMTNERSREDWRAAYGLRSALQSAGRN